MADEMRDRFYVEQGDALSPNLYLVDQAINGGAYIATFDCRGLDGDHPFVINQYRRADLLADILNAATRFKVGDRVKLLHSIESFPFGIAPKGSTGTITAIDRAPDAIIAIQLDDLYIASAFLEWDGAVWLYDHNYPSLEHAAFDNLELTDTPAPVYAVNGRQVDIYEYTCENFVALNPETGTESQVALDKYYNLRPGQSVVVNGDTVTRIK